MYIQFSFNPSKEEKERKKEKVKYGTGKQRNRGRRISQAYFMKVVSNQIETLNRKLKNNIHDDHKFKCSINTC